LRLYPAVDIRGGRAVRLVQGDYERETIFDSDPLDAALRWVDGGAEIVHVVDLDGARDGRPSNLEHVRRIAGEAGVPVQVGGGVRDADAVETLLDAGADRVVMGTALQRDPSLADALVAAHGERIVAGIDARGGSVAVEGWTESTGQSAADLAAELCERGVQRFVFTPVEVDGMLTGPGLDQLREVAPHARGELVYSGGIGTLDHLRDLVQCGVERLSGVIVGRALYEGRFTIEEARVALEADR